eukprot:TRINITY_DN5985_c0_g1_i1.p1 TRINITY_DN5985_c0_g1~~TRINITY_DN5985_c0_g1_i1.p1  ORF type:complete len:693 (-),score=170.57 TRINITY_DN5985_c0_g1_i1:2-1786(-)
MEEVIVILFSIEYLVRLFSYPNRLKWVIKPMQIVDFLAIFPFYLGIVFSQNESLLAVVRVLRLVRVFRVFKLSRYSLGFRLVVRTLWLSHEALVLLLYLVSMAMIVSGSLVFFAERGHWDTSRKMWINDGVPSQFQSVFDGFWYAIVTMTTVGYGDITPLTFGGKVIGALTIMIGVLTLAFPIAIVGTNFTAEWKKAKEKQRHEKIRRKEIRLRKKQLTMAALQQTQPPPPPPRSDFISIDSAEFSGTVADLLPPRSHFSMATFAGERINDNFSDDDDDGDHKRLTDDPITKIKVMRPTDTVREKINIIFSHPRSSKIGVCVMNLGLFVIVLSIIAFALQTLPSLHEKEEEWFVVEAIITVYFSIEIILRFWSSPSRKIFFKDFFNYIDLLAILPFYIELSGHGDSRSLSLIRIVRMARIFRIFKISRYADGLRAVTQTIKESKDALILMLTLFSIAIVLFGTLIFFAERGHWDENLRGWVRHDGSLSPYQSIIHSFWWCIVTMMTVGYGDDVPVTWGGKVIGGVTMLSGLLIVAFPVSIIGVNFSSEWDHVAQRQRTPAPNEQPPDAARTTELQLPVETAAAGLPAETTLNTS